MPYLIVKHTVRDFDQWLAVFESQAESQKEAGFGDAHILRDYKDPHIVICLFKVLDFAKARAFTQAPELNNLSYTGNLGPYRYKEWIRNDKIVMERNPDYYLGKENGAP